MMLDLGLGSQDVGSLGWRQPRGEPDVGSLGWGHP